MQSVLQLGSEKHLFRYVARQPILGADKKIFGYELLFRSGIENFFQSIDGDDASRSVIDLSSLHGFNVLCNSRYAFINCSRETLLGDYIYLLPPERVVVEVLETVTPDMSVRQACTRLKDAGYRIALDDFVSNDPRGSLTDLADFIKVDLTLVSHDDARKLVDRYRGKRCQLLAEKVETWQDFEIMIDSGFTLFQGYFFRKPEMMRMRRALPNRKVYQKLLLAVTRPQPDWKEVEDTLAMDATLCYRFLRYMNSAAFGLRNEVHSLRRAFVILGEDALIRWCRLAAVLEMSRKSQSDLALSALIRAKFAELIGSRVDHGGTDLFLLGLLSLMDSILEAPMKVVLDDLLLNADLKSALLTSSGRLGTIYTLIEAVDSGSWKTVTTLCAEMQLAEDFVAKSYWDAMGWAHSIATAA